MTTPLLLGVDIGTQGTKAALFDTRGRCLARAFFKSRLHQPAPGTVEEDPESQVASVCATIAQCLKSAKADAGHVAGIGIDGQMAGVIGVGKDGRAVTPYDSWLDTRCAPYIKQMQDAAGPEITRKAGGPPSFNHGPKILRWKREFPRIFKKVASFVQPGGYAVMRLCGLDGTRAFIDKSYLHFSGFADNRNNCWDAGLCARFAVDPAKLPAIVDSHTVMGELTANMAAKCGLKPGVPVVAGCGDTAASFLACGATREGICVDVAGTASVFAATTAEFRADIRGGVLSCGRAATPGLWHPYAYINGGGMNLEWFRREFGNGLDFDALNRLAGKIVPALEDPLFIPHLAGRVSPGWPHLRGAWAGLTWAHATGHLYRAMLEGVALEYRLYKEALMELYPRLKVRELRITGGGEKSAAWNVIKADALNCRVLQIAASEGAPMGAAMLAGFGVGLLEDLDQAASKWIETGSATSPNRRLARLYETRYRRYVDLLNKMNEWSET
ncbi:MAG: xylulokinase [Kiritimatiellia bacterium]